MTAMLNHYLSESCKGDRKAAYEAARIMTFNKYNDVLIQNQYRHSAKLGYAPAQRELGILGLCSRLIIPSSTVSNIIYYNDNFAQAVYWLKEAAKNHDGVAVYILGKCYQSGIGVELNTERAARLFELSSKLLPLDRMLVLNFATSMIADSLCTTSCNKNNYFEDDLLALVG